MGDKIQKIIQLLTLEEKASLCSGHDFWNLESVESKGVPPLLLTDGPHGLRKQAGDTDHVGINKSLPATCFPPACTLAASWNTELVNKIGKALGEECRKENVGILLGPGANIKRSPLCGRNFEYFSEDPYLSGALAAKFIQGVQSHGIGTSLKHFAANNQERFRMAIDAVIDDRALREIYLAGFETAVKNAQPHTVMCAYNKVNGEYCSENKKLLNDILKDEWGFKGFVVTDWGAINNRVKGLNAGLELEMPGNNGLNDAKIVKAVREGTLDESILDAALQRLLTVTLACSAALAEDFHCDMDEHHALAKKAAAEGSVLLKNDGLLPLQTAQKIAVIGEFAKKPRYQGSGSSLINPVKLDNAWDAICTIVGNDENLFYAQGYDSQSENVDQTMINEAIDAANAADIVILFAGLTELAESEGFDRAHLDLPKSHTALINAVAETNTKTILVLSNGAPVLMPWLEKVSAVLETYLGGQAWGTAVADILFGKINPSGKLAETFPASLESIAASANFPGGSKAVMYAESIFVGYRWFDTAQKPVLFPFGHGLSYTNFAYSNLQVVQNGESITVRFTLTNTGSHDGAESAQIYIKDLESTVFKAEKELKGFQKVFLKVAEARTLTVELDRRAFAFWDTGSQNWCVEAGEFEILVGASSADIRLRQTITYASSDVLSAWAQNIKQKAPQYYTAAQLNMRDFSSESGFAYLLAHDVPEENYQAGEAFTEYTAMEQVRSTFVGKILYKIVLKEAKKRFMHDDVDIKMYNMMEAIVREMPLKNLVSMSNGTINSRKLEALISMINGHYRKGLCQFLKKEKNQDSS